MAHVRKILRELGWKPCYDDLEGELEWKPHFDDLKKIISSAWEWEQKRLTGGKALVVKKGKENCCLKLYGCYESIDLGMYDTAGACAFTAMPV